MTARIRSLMFGQMLRQEIGFFDRKDNGVGALCTRLSGDVSSIQGVSRTIKFIKRKKKVIGGNSKLRPCDILNKCRQIPSLLSHLIMLQLSTKKSFLTRNNKN